MTEHGTAEAQGRRLRILFGVPILIGLVVCAVIAVLQDGSARQPSLLLGGIDGYLSDKYGASAASFGAFASRTQVVYCSPMHAMVCTFIDRSARFPICVCLAACSPFKARARVLTSSCLELRRRMAVTLLLQRIYQRARTFLRPCLHADWG